MTNPQKIKEELKKEFVDFCDSMPTSFYEHHEKVKSFIHSTIEEVLKEKREEVEKILVDEINLARTTKSGKTSRLTSAYMRISKLFTPPHSEDKE